MTKKQQRKFHFVDLFAGCGGLSLGLEQAGWTPVFVNELNTDAMKTYLQNREEFGLEESGRFVHDIKDLVRGDGQALDDLAAGLKKVEKIDVRNGDLDLVVGGPPCQGFSGIGHRRSYSVHKKQLPSNHLYQDMAFVVSKLRPRVFLFENVRGLLTARWDNRGEKGEIWDDVLATFRGLEEYDVRFSLVYAKQYGVPQNRPRVLMVGLRRDALVKAPSDAVDAVRAGFLPEGTGGYPNLVELLGDLVDRRYKNGGVTERYPGQPKNELQCKLRTNRVNGRTARKGEALFDQEYSKHSEKIVAKFQHMINHDGEIPREMRTKKFAQRVLPKRWGPGGPSITATSLSDDYVHFEQPRNLTVREWARLQLFPDWYAFAGKRTTGGLRRAGNPRAGIFDREVPKYTQIGNAVPVGLAQKIGEHFKFLIR